MSKRKRRGEKKSRKEMVHCCSLSLTCSHVNHPFGCRRVDERAKWRKGARDSNKVRGHRVDQREQAVLILKLPVLKPAKTTSLPLTAQGQGQ
ncbi:hypothetical protein SRHO_G00330140 [Serrasalmus rhombeus]